HQEKKTEDWRPGHRDAVERFAYRPELDTPTDATEQNRLR
nr:hypothetical protein [Tanacetum cinerariifolium]